MRILPDATIDEMLARAPSQAAREDVERLAGEVRRLREVLTDEAEHRGYWAREASRLLDVVERGSQLRSAMVAEAIRNEREGCARAADACAETYDAPHCDDCDTAEGTRRHAPYVCPTLGMSTDPRDALRALASAIRSRS